MDHLIKSLYAAINSGDIEGTTAFFHADIERIEPEGFPTSGTYRGRKAVQAHLSRGRATWAEGSCEPERIVTKGDKAVALVRVHVRLKDHTDWIDAQIADGFIVRGDQITYMRTFAESGPALDWLAQS